MVVLAYDFLAPLESLAVVLAYDFLAPLESLAVVLAYWHCAFPDMEVVVPLAYMLLGLVDTVLAQTYLDMAWLVDQDNMGLDKDYTQAHTDYRLDSFVADMETLADIGLLFLLVLFGLAVLAL